MVTFCLHDEEWQAVKTMRQKYFFDRASREDPYQWTFDHKNHKHFVLYCGADIVGYAHIQLWPENRAALRIIVIEEDFRGAGLGSEFLGQCEKWLKQHGCQILNIESSAEALCFYEKHGYTPMLFHDPEGHPTDPRDTAIGKRL